MKKIDATGAYGPVLLFMAVFFLFPLAPACGQTLKKADVIKRAFDLTGSQREVVEFTVTQPSGMMATATWSGSAGQLTLILNGPGQTQAYSRKDGQSPLRLSFSVTEKHLRAGNTWRISVVNFSRSGSAQGTLSITMNPRKSGKLTVVKPTESDSRIKTAGQTQSNRIKPSFQPRSNVTDPIPPNASDRAEYTCDLKSGQSFQFDLPLFPGGTIATVKAVPEAAHQKTGTTRFQGNYRKYRRTTLATIDRDIDALIAQQKREQARKVLNCVVRIKGRTYHPEQDLSNKYSFLFLIPQAGTGKTARATLSTYGNASFKGKLVVVTMDRAEKEKLEASKKRRDIEEAIARMHNPDFFWALVHTMKRHLRAYPGGKSDFEKSFEKNLSQLNLSGQTISTMLRELKPYEAYLKSRVSDRQLARMPLGQPVKRTTFRKILGMAPPEKGMQIEKAPGVRPLELKNTEREIKVLYPNGGETWRLGETYTIRWQSNIRRNVNIELRIGAFGKPGTMYTIGRNLPNNGSYSFTLPESFPYESDKIVVSVTSVDGGVTDFSDNYFTIVSELYTIRLLGLKSYRCADDEGWEKGCDTEEPYIVWATFGPGYDAVGRTDEGKVRNGDFCMFWQDTRVYGGGTGRMEAIPVNPPLLYVYMVIEKDSGSPSREEVLGATKTAVGAVASFLTGDWEDAIKEGFSFIYDTIVIFQKIFAGGDDVYPPYISYFDRENLLSLTSGNGMPPLDRRLDQSTGNYDHLSIRQVPVTNHKGDLEWGVYYIIMRKKL